jgi:rifampicin phosphotransferase
MRRVPAGLDTQPHPVFGTYSAGNFAEVAPQRLSVMSWSLLGDPVERGVRALVSRLWPSARWYSGSHYAFVGYFRCRPYHNLAGFCHMARELPGLTSADVTSSYFEDAPTPTLPRGLRGPARTRALAVPRMARELLSLRPRLTELEGEIVELEERTASALASGSLTSLGACLERGRGALDSAWGLHYTTTLALVPLLAMQRGVGRRVVAHWSDLERWLNRPRELVWAALAELAGAEHPLPAAAFLDRAFYEVADDQEPWIGYVSRRREEVGGPGRARAWRDPAAVAWDIEPLARAALLPQLTRAVGDTMACRETSKSLAMRCLQAFRGLIPALADAAGVSAAAWPYLTIGELAEPADAAALETRAQRRQELCEMALAEEAPGQLRFDRGPTVAASGAPPRRPALGLSPGRVTGVVVDRGGAGEDRDGPKILVCEAADADVQPLLPLIDGILTARGSALSHVAILVREHGIPAVVGHPLTGMLTPGQRVAIDGTRGEVSLVGAEGSTD